MKVFLIIIMCSILVGCSKRTEKTDQQKSGKDTTNQQVKKDTTKPSVTTKKETVKNQEIKKDTVIEANLSYEQKQGKYIFTKYCAVCHGELGKGNGFNAYNLNPKPKSFTDSNYIAAYSDERLTESIIKGGRGVNKSPLMPSYTGTLNKDELIYIVRYVRFLNEQKR